MGSYGKHGNMKVADWERLRGLAEGQRIGFQALFALAMAEVAKCFARLTFGLKEGEQR